MKSSTHPGPPLFSTTRWSLVESVASADSTAAAAALEELCATYWKPVYAYARRLGNAPADALDLTQGFFARVIQGRYFAQADPARGRLRSFLLASFKHYLANERARERTQRRGGGVRFVPLDETDAETKVRVDPVDANSPDRVFDRQWALALLDAVLENLRADYRRRGEERLFDVLQCCLAAGRDRLSYSELGREIGLSEGAVKVAVFRMRERYRELLRREVAGTVAASEGAETELRHLFHALSG